METKIIKESDGIKTMAIYSGENNLKEFYQAGKAKDFLNKLGRYKNESKNS